MLVKAAVCCWALGLWNEMRRTPEALQYDWRRLTPGVWEGFFNFYLKKGCFFGDKHGEHITNTYKDIMYIYIYKLYVYKKISKTKFMSILYT